MAAHKRIAFLHIAPRAGDLAANRDMVRAGIAQAADCGASWVITPELSTSGYTFAETLGLDWIAPLPDPWTRELESFASSRGMTLVLASAERDATSGLLYNSLCVFDGPRGLIGCHRKVNTLKIGSEAWSSPGSAATVVDLGQHKVGLLICADACSAALGDEITSQGASAIVSSANWAPGEWGPAGEWEAMSASTGLPMFVCNRTGEDATLSFSRAETVVVAHGARQLSFSCPEARLVLVDWDFSTNQMLDWSSSEFY